MKASAGDFWAGAALAALGAYVVAEARQWDYLTPEGPGAGFFPTWYGIAMVALAVFLLASNIRFRARIETGQVLRALSLWLALVVTVALFRWLGFVVSFALFTFFLAAVVYRRPPAVAAATAAGVSAGFYAVFDLALGVGLPAGALGF